jgi:molybdopterin synthase sulfur carrier subunit
MNPDAPMNKAASVPVRVRLPAQLCALAGVPAEVVVEAEAPLSQRKVLDALEQAHPALLGTIRNRATGSRRAFVRFFVGETDVSNGAPDDPLPAVVANGGEAFVVVGAMAGG